MYYFSLAQDLLFSLRPLSQLFFVQKFLEFVQKIKGQAVFLKKEHFTYKKRIIYYNIYKYKDFKDIELYVFTKYLNFVF